MATIPELEAKIETLRAQVEELRSARDLTLRDQGRCRSCGGRISFHLAAIPDQVADGTPRPMAFNVRRLFASVERSAEVEAFVCAGCGLIEWYVKRVQDLVPDDRRVSLHGPDREGDGDPFR